MSLLLALAALAADPVQTAEEEREILSWTCSVAERPDRNVHGSLSIIVKPDGSRGEMSYYVHWSAQPGHSAQQSMNWIWIPLDAVKLWKPDEIEIGVKVERSDETGSVSFKSPRYERIWRPARGLAKSLRPTFDSTAVTIGEPYLIAQLWAGWPWSVDLSDTRGQPLGSQAVLLPGPDAAQAMFDRLRARLEALSRDAASKCQANLGPTRREMEESLIHWGTPIRRPNLSSATPVTVVDPPPR
ncbi:MAG TPA: hypothetical protein VFR28_06780 [Allosphingosinicella sp.]|jgi:hypothetical protein|nr:hypothetical protein [Allosphingosinicella sp.]